MKKHPIVRNEIEIHNGKTLKRREHKSHKKNKKYQIENRCIKGSEDEDNVKALKNNTIYIYSRCIIMLRLSITNYLLCFV